MILWLAAGGRREGGEPQLSHTLSLSTRSAANIGDTITIRVAVSLKFVVSASEQYGLCGIKSLEVCCINWFTERQYFPL